MEAVVAEFGTTDERGADIENCRNECDDHCHPPEHDHRPLSVNQESKEAEIAEFDAEDGGPNQCAKWIKVSLDLRDLTDHYLHGDLRDKRGILLDKVVRCNQLVKRRRADDLQGCSSDQASTGERYEDEVIKNLMLSFRNANERPP